jgi:hypothetical protein
VYHGFRGGKLVPKHTKVPLITMVQLFYPKYRVTFYHGITMVIPWQNVPWLWGGTFVPCYTMVQLITMVQMRHSKNHGILNHGITMVKSVMVSWGGTFVPW